MISFTIKENTKYYIGDAYTKLSLFEYALYKHTHWNSLNMFIKNDDDENYSVIHGIDDYYINGIIFTEYIKNLDNLMNIGTFIISKQRDIIDFTTPIKSNKSTLFITENGILIGGLSGLLYYSLVYKDKEIIIAHNSMRYRINTNLILIDGNHVCSYDNQRLIDLENETYIISKLNVMPHFADDFSIRGEVLHIKTNRIAANTNVIEKLIEIYHIKTIKIDETIDASNLFQFNLQIELI